MPKLYRHQIDIHLGRRVFHPDRKKIGRLTILVCDEFESNPNWKNKQGGIDIPIGKKVCTIPDHRCFAFGQSTLRDEGILQYPIILLSNEENHICSIVKPENLNNKMVSVFARGISPDPSLPKELKGRSVEDLIRGVMKAPRPIKENPEYPLDLKEVVKNLFIDEKTHKAAQEVADAFEEITVPSKDRYQKDIRYGSGEPHKKRDNFP